MDYRCSKYCPSFENVGVNKDKFKKEFLKSHPRAKNHYNYLSKQASPLKAKYIVEVFNGKCAYCGASINYTNIDLFEIDHFVAESISHNNDMYNLVASCKACNRLKKEFNFVSPQKFNVINGINKLYYRSDDYAILINNAYISDSIVCDFYDRMNFSSQNKRLDYLLLSLIGLIENTSSDKKKSQLMELKDKLLSKKNKISSFIK